jgi:plastocyanin
VDGIHIPAKQTTINSKVRALVINFNKDSSKIEIQNTVPAKAALFVQRHPTTNYQVSIVQGASTMDGKAFSRNPINIKAGDMVTWTNDDSTPHTLTSGTGLSDPNMGREFDSSPSPNALIAPGQTFSHTFTSTGEFAYFSETHPTMVGKVIVTGESKIPGKQVPAIPPLNNRNLSISVSPTPSVQPSTSRPSTTGPSINNQNPTNTRIDYGSLCTKLQPVLVQSCHILVNNNNSLTSQGNYALHCVKSAILLSGNPSSWVGVPLSVVLNGLSMLAPPAGCDEMVNMSGFSQLANIGSLNSIIRVLP